MVFADLDEVQQALTAGVVSLHAKIKCRIFKMRQRTASGEPAPEGGRDHARAGMLLYEILPQHPNVSFDRLLNRVLTKKEITQVIDEVYRHCGQKETVIFADRLMKLGFSHACQGRHLVRQGRHGHPRRPSGAWSTRPRSWSSSTSSSTPTA